MNRAPTPKPGARTSRRGFALASSGDGVVDSALAPLAPFFGREGVEDIVACRPGELRLELGGRWAVERNERFSLGWWRELCAVLAAWQGAAWDEDHPRVSLQLPGGHRFEAMLGPAVASGVSVAIRVKRRGRYEYEDFGVSAELRATLEGAARDGLNVLISGGTASGKTSFANRFARDVPSDQRVLVAEDTAELDEHAENMVRFLVGRHGGAVDYGMVFDHCMRARPDRLWLGEVSVKNAFATLLFLNNGHKGLLSTLHANSCRDAIETAFWMRAALAGADVSKAVVAEFLKTSVDLVVQVSRHAGVRRVVETWWPQVEAEPTRYVGGRL